MEGYAGICGVCFNPVENSEEIHFRERGRHFHKTCAENNPDSYYVALERIWGQFERRERPAHHLMNKIEHIFHIPALNNEQFNQANPEVIELYRAISDSRKQRWKSEFDR